MKRVLMVLMVMVMLLIGSIAFADTYSLLKGAWIEFGVVTTSLTEGSVVYFYEDDIYNRVDMVIVKSDEEGIAQINGPTFRGEYRISFDNQIVTEYREAYHEDNTFWKTVDFNIYYDYSIEKRGELWLLYLFDGSDEYLYVKMPE